MPIPVVAIQELRQSRGHIKGESPLLKPTGIQNATTSMLGPTTNGEHRKLIGVTTMFLFGYGIQLLLSGVLQVFQNRNYELQRRLSGLLPNQQSRQKYVCRCTCVARGSLSIFHYSIIWLSRWRYGEALCRGFLYTTKLESKFILRPTGIPPPDL